jgi:hypothetical protein
MRECVSEAMRRRLLFEWPGQPEDQLQSFIAPDVTELLGVSSHAAPKNQRAMNSLSSPETSHKPIR